MGSTSSAAGLTGCQRVCSNCGSAAEAAAGDGGVRFCDSWGEEEVPSLPQDPPSVGLDYGFLGGGLGGAESSENPPARTALFEPGTLVPLHGLGWPNSSASVQDCYELDREPLGRGSYGEVHGATHRASGARRAVKSVGKAALRRYVSNVSGFVRREVDILRRLDHPNIVRLYEAFEDDATIYLVLEICDGGDLLERVSHARERMPESEAAQIFAQMVASVQHLYLRNVIHRDIKPENFLFSQREPGREPLPPEVSPIKLIDFGLSRSLGQTSTPSMRSSPLGVGREVGSRITPKIGTTEYMAPEAFAGKAKVALVDRTDVWSLGVVLHVIFIGHFPSPRLQEQQPEEYLSASCWSRVSPQGLDLLAQLLRRDPAARPPVTVVLKHPWLGVATGRLPPALVHAMPSAIRGFAQSSRLRRLALAAVAREAADCDLARVRALFQVLELQCDGALTRPALERVAWNQSVTGSLARELARAFDAIDVDGSGCVDWSELVAISLSAASALTGPGDDAQVVSARGLAVSAALPVLRDDVCWRAFDLLSQSTEAISGAALGALLSPGEETPGGIGSWLAARATGGGTGGSGSGLPGSNRVVELDALVREVEPGGNMVAAGFQRLLTEQQ